MPDTTGGVVMPFPASVSFPRPVSFEMDAALKSAVADLPASSRGQMSATVTRTGIEARVAYQPRPFLTLGGYAARLWGGGWQAGARAVLTFGGAR